MTHISTKPRSEGFPRARSEPHPGWALVWLPLLLIVLGDSSGLGSARARLAVVLLLGIIAWGLGRGPAGIWAERGFAALLLVGWFAVCGTSFRLHGVPVSMPARLVLTAGLLLGPVLLLWAWRRRAGMVPVVDEAGIGTEPGSAGTVLRALVGVVATLWALDRLLGLQPADLLVVGAGLLLFTTFRIRGRQQGFGTLG